VKRRRDHRHAAIALAWPFLLAALFLAALEPATPVAATHALTGDALAAAPLRGLPQPASVTATPRLRLPTDTPASLAPPAATGTVVRVSITAAPRSSATPAGGAPSGGAETPPAGEAAGTPSIAPGATGGAAGGGSPGSAGGAAPQSGSDPGPPGRSGDSRATTDEAVDPVAAPSGLLSAPVADPGIRRLWAATGSPRAGQSWLARLTADRPGPWGWGLSYPLLALAFLWAFRRAWRSVAALCAAEAPRAAGGDGRG
jgi:hypothetical protein